MLTYAEKIKKGAAAPPLDRMLKGGKGTTTPPVYATVY